MLVAETITELRAYSSGIWGPAKSTKVTYGLGVDGRHGKLSTIIATYGKDFLINPSIDDDAYKLRVPSGTEIYDPSIDAVYQQP